MKTAKRPESGKCFKCTCLDYI